MYYLCVGFCISGCFDNGITLIGNKLIGWSELQIKGHFDLNYGIGFLFISMKTYIMTIISA